MKKSNHKTHIEKNSSPKYPHNTAGYVMTPKVPTIMPKQTVGHAKLTLLQDVHRFDTINYIYVIDAGGKLVGVVSIKELFRNQEGKEISEIMEKSLRVVRGHTDRERVVLLALKYNLKAIPAVDRENIFLGVVQSDDILNILHQESVEDALVSAGITTLGKDAPRHIFEGGIRHQILRRLPWLLVGLVGGVVAAVVIRSFEDILETELLFAAFIPVVIYLADAVGAQTQTIYIRSNALGNNIDIRKYFLEELKIGGSIAFLLAITIALISFFFFNSLVVGIAVSISLIVTVVLASMVAVGLPYLFIRFRKDPAVASGPLATVIRDLLSLAIYFGVVTGVLMFI